MNDKVDKVLMAVLTAVTIVLALAGMFLIIYGFVSLTLGAK